MYCCKTHKISRFIIRLIAIRRTNFGRDLCSGAISGYFRNPFIGSSEFVRGLHAVVSNAKHHGIDLFWCIAAFISPVSQRHIVQFRQNLCLFAISGNFRHPFCRELGIRSYLRGELRSVTHTPNKYIFLDNLLCSSLYIFLSLTVFWRARMASQNTNTDLERK